MRVFRRIQQSRARIAAAASAVLLAVLAAGVSFAPAANASTGTGTTGARSASQTAATVKPDEEVLYFGGVYPTLEDCDASLQEVETNPYFAGGECVYQEDGTYWMWYILDEPVCNSPATVAGTPAVRTGVVAGRLAAAAC